MDSVTFNQSTGDVRNAYVIHFRIPEKVGGWANIPWYKRFILKGYRIVEEADKIHAAV